MTEELIQETFTHLVTWNLCLSFYLVRINWKKKMFETNKYTYKHDEMGKVLLFNKTELFLYYTISCMETKKIRSSNLNSVSICL